MSGPSFGSKPGGSGVSLDTTATDIQPLGTQAAGSTGKAADAGHVHQMPRLDQVAAPTAAVAANSQKITGLANGTASTDAAAFGQIPVIDATAGDFVMDGVASAGSTGKVADAGHRHPTDTTRMAAATTLDAIPAPAAAVALNAKKITGLANGSAASDAAAFGQLPAVSFLPGRNGLIAAIDPHQAPYNAKGDVIHVFDGAMTSGSPNLACATSTPFTSTAVDGGKQIVVMGAGAAGAALKTTISTVTDSGHAVLAANAGTTTSAQAVQFGTDDTTAINNAILAAYNVTVGDPNFANGGGEIQLSARDYLITGSILSKTNTTLRGQGIGATGIHQQYANAFTMWTVATAFENTWWVRDLRFDAHGRQQTATATGFVFNRSSAGNLATAPFTPPFYDNQPWFTATSYFANDVGGDLKGMENIALWHVNGDAMTGTDFAVYMHKIFVLDVNGHGFNGTFSDSDFVDWQVGGCNKSNVVDNGANNRWSVLKTYIWNGALSTFPSVDLQGNKITMDGVEIQQGVGPGLRFAGAGNHRVTGRVDGSLGDCIVIQSASVGNCTADMTVTGFTGGFVPPYYLNAAGYNNRIRLRATGATAGLIHGTVIGCDVQINGGSRRGKFTKVEVAGHVNGAGTGLTSAANDSYVNRLARTINIGTVTNYSETGGSTSAGGLYGTVAGAGINNGSIVTDVLNQVTRPNRTFPFLAGSGLVILDDARYDAILYNFGSGFTQQQNQGKHGLRAVISRFLSCAVYEGTDAALTFTGSWAASASDPGFSGGETRAAGANGDTITMTVPAGWPGGYAVLGAKCVPAGNGAVFTATGTGVTTTALDTRGLIATGTGPATARIPVAASAAGQTLTITVSSFTTAAAFDYLAFEMPIGSANPAWNLSNYPGGTYNLAGTLSSPPLILVLGAPRLPSYTTAGQANALSDSHMDNLSASMLAVVQEYASTRVVFVDTNGAMATYQATADANSYQSNGAYFSQFGHARLAGSLQAYIGAAGMSDMDYASLA